MTSTSNYQAGDHTKSDSSNDPEKPDVIDHERTQARDLRY